MLDAYGFDDEQDLAALIAVQDVYVEIWQMYDGQRRRCQDQRCQSEPLRLDRPLSA
jgi:hypothetical protein